MSKSRPLDPAVKAEGKRRYQRYRRKEGALNRAREEWRAWCRAPGRTAPQIAEVCVGVGVDGEPPKIVSPAAAAKQRRLALQSDPST